MFACCWLSISNSEQSYMSLWGTPGLSESSSNRRTWPFLYRHHVGNSLKRLKFGLGTKNTWLRLENVHVLGLNKYISYVTEVMFLCNASIVMQTLTLFAPWLYSFAPVLIISPLRHVALVASLHGWHVRPFLWWGRVEHLVYSAQIRHTASCCSKYSLAHKLWINPSLKIVPQPTNHSLLSEQYSLKPTVSSCLG